MLRLPDGALRVIVTKLTTALKASCTFRLVVADIAGDRRILAIAGGQEVMACELSRRVGRRARRGMSGPEDRAVSPGYTTATPSALAALASAASSVARSAPRRRERSRYIAS